MTEDFIGRTGERPKQSFTQEKFNSYMQQLAPYQERLSEKHLLTSDELMELQGIKRELRQTYTRKSLTAWQMYSRVTRLLDTNTILLEETLEREERSVARELQRREATGTPTPEYQAQARARLEQLCLKLDPYHYHQAPK